VARGTIRPDLVLADYNLPNRLNGVQLAAKLREKLHHETPVIILTGDISTTTLRDIALHDCVQLNKPVKPTELMEVIQRLLSISQTATHPQPAETVLSPVSPVVFVVDDDSLVREAIRCVSRKMAGPLKPIRPARHSSTPIVPGAKHVS